MTTLQTNQPPAVYAAGPRDKLKSLLETVLQDSRINAAFRPVIMQLANNFLDGTTDEEIINGLGQLRDKLIPWVIGDPAPAESGPDEDTHKE